MNAKKLGALPLGAHVHAGPSTRFALHSSRARRVALRLYEDAKTPLDTLPMHPVDDGYFELFAEGVGHGALYKLVLDGAEYPDPYARYLPYGVHGPAMVVQSSYTFKHPRPPHPPAQRQVIYEIHVGTFTPPGSYAAACLKLAELAALGVSTLELMPVAAFDGTRGWGYDGVALFAPFAPYGTPDELRALVDTAHGLGMTVLLDVVYNHFGPSGNYLAAFSPEYFTHDVQNAWGDAPNYPFAPMHALVLENVRYWLDEFRFDGLRLDATHAIVDPGEPHILGHIAQTGHEVSSQSQLIAEDDRNEPGLVTRLGLDGIWADDFHHQVHVTLTREQDGYYAGFRAGVGDLARCIEHGWLYEGQVFAGQKPRGKPASELPFEALIYCIQNHDQIGNRAFGERLNHLIARDAYRMASAILLFLPMPALLFMGQEWAASSPFQYFTDHEPELGQKVVFGRRDEFKHFSAFSDPEKREKIPNPQAEETFLRSKLVWEERARGEHAEMLETYRKLLALRRTDRVLGKSGRRHLSAHADGELLVVRRWDDDEERCLYANFGAAPRSLARDEPGEPLFGALSEAGALLPQSVLITATKRTAR